MVRRLLPAVLALSLLAAAPAADAGPPSDFETRVLAAGLDLPTGFTEVSDGRIFVAEKGGRVRVVDGGALLATPVIDIGDKVAEWGDRGLLGIAADRDFASNGHLYLLYTYDTDVTVPEGPKVSRLTRITVTPENAVENPQQPETVLLGKSPLQACPLDNTVDCIPSEGIWHTIGSVRVDPTDGTLWVGSGDATMQYLYPEQALRVQDPRSLAGKVLHIDREGRGLPGHPFCPSDGDLTHNCTKVAALGFRNPFRFTVSDQGVVVGDVGSIYTEEINLLTPGGNYGWPCLEGLNELDWRDTCESQSFTAPLFGYGHWNQQGRVDSSITAGPRLEGGPWPQTYQGNIFFADYARRWIRRIVNENGSWRDYSFDDEAGSVVDLQQRPNGNLLYLDIWDWVYGEDPAGTLKEIAYSPDGRRPIARFSVSDRHGPLPLEATFDASASSDPDGGALSYAWDFEDDGVTDATGPVAVHTFTDAGPVVARLTVSSGGDSATRAVSLWPGNTPPEVTITAPADGSRAPHGSRVYAQATAEDAEDGELRGCQLRWHVGYVHDTPHPPVRLVLRPAGLVRRREQRARRRRPLPAHARGARQRRRARREGRRHLPGCRREPR